MDTIHPKPAKTSDPEADAPPRAVTITLLVYALQATSLLGALTMVIGVIINYLTRAKVRATWLESHYRWQIRTFWYALLGTWAGTLPIVSTEVWKVPAQPSMVTQAGYVLVSLTYAWAIYRVARGWISLAKGLPVTPLLRGIRRERGPSDRTA